MRTVKATLRVTLKETGVMKQVQTLLNRVANQRPLSVLGRSVSSHSITLWLLGDRLDVFVLANAVASSFPQVHVELEAGEAELPAAPARGPSGLGGGRASRAARPLLFR